MDLPEKMKDVIKLLPDDVDIVVLDGFMLLSFQKDYEDELQITQIIELAAANPTGIAADA